MARSKRSPSNRNFAHIVAIEGAARAASGNVRITVSMRNTAEV